MTQQVLEEYNSFPTT